MARHTAIRRTSLEDGWEPLLNGKDLAGLEGLRGRREERVVHDEARPLRADPRADAAQRPAGAERRHPERPDRTDREPLHRAHVRRRRALPRVHARQGLELGRVSAGLYEIQIFDSWGSIEGMKTSDGGAIYHQWIDNRGVGGSPPLVNAVAAARRVAVVSGVVPGAAVRRRRQEDRAGALRARAVQRQPCRRTSTSMVRRAPSCRFPKPRRTR